MNRLLLITSMGAVLALPACLLEHDLGETAEDSGSGGGTGTGPELPPDPSATSSAVTFPTSGGEEGTDEPPDPSGATDPDPPATDSGVEPGCEQVPDIVGWGPEASDSEPVVGMEIGEIAILSGECTVGTVIEGTGQGNDPAWTLPLDCMLSGRLDADPMFVGAMSPQLAFHGTVPSSEVLGSFGEQVQLSVVLDFWGFGWNGWVVIESLEGTPLLDLVSAEYLDPTESTWGLEVEERLAGEAWHDELMLGTTEAECELPTGTCGSEDVALTVAWGEAEPLLLHPWQEGTIGTPIPELQIRTSVRKAYVNPQPTCTDTTLSGFGLAAWAVMP